METAARETGKRELPGSGMGMYGEEVGGSGGGGCAWVQRLRGRGRGRGTYAWLYISGLRECPRCRRDAYWYCAR